MRRNFALRSLLPAAAFALAGLLAGPAAAAGNSVYTAGGEVRTAAPVLGDYTAAGGNVVVDHPVSGDAQLAGGAVEVRSPVAGDLRIASGDAKLAAAVGGELFVVGGTIVLEQGAVVAQDARIYGGKLRIDGRVERDLEVKADRVVINGEVRGDARVHASHIELGPLAKIQGALHYVSEHELVRAEGSTVVGTIDRDERASARPRERSPERAATRAARWFGGVASFVTVLAVAALFLLAAPGFGARAAQRVRATPWTVLGLGLATLLAVPMLAVTLFITVLGIPFALALLALYPLALLLGFVVSVLFLARGLPPAFRLPAPQSLGATLGWFAAALLLVMVVARIPFLGAVLMLLVALAGLGAGVLELHARYRRPSQPGGGAHTGARAPVAAPDEAAGAQA